MKKLSLIHFLLLACGIIGLGFLAMPAQAQDAQKVQELQHVIDAQQRQLENQQQQLDAQRQLLQNLQKQMESLAKDKDTKGTVVAEKPPAKQPMDFTKVPPPKKVALSQMDKYDREHPSGTPIGNTHRGQMSE